MDPLNPTASSVETALFDIEIMVRRAIADGTILNVMNTRRAEILATFVHTGSADLRIQQVFAEHTFVSNFIGSWKVHQARPEFVKYWQSRILQVPMAEAIAARQEVLNNMPPEASMMDVDRAEGSKDGPPAKGKTRVRKAKAAGIAGPAPPPTATRVKKAKATRAAPPAPVPMGHPAQVTAAATPQAAQLAPLPSQLPMPQLAAPQSVPPPAQVRQPAPSQLAPARPPASQLVPQSPHETPQTAPILPQTAPQTKPRRTAPQTKPPQTKPPPTAPPQPAPPQPAPPQPAPPQMEPQTKSPQTALRQPAPRQSSLPRSSTQPEPSRPARSPTVRLVGRIATSESSDGSGDEFVPAALSKSKGKQRAKRSDISNEDDRAMYSDVEMTPLETAATTKPTHKRRNAAPAPGGELHIPPCQQCANKQQPCRKEIGGGACFRCTKLKSKCEYSGVKGQRVFPRKTERRRRPSYNRMALKKEKKTQKVVKKKSKWVDVDVESDKDVGDMTEQETEAPEERRRRSASPDAIGPAHSSRPATSVPPANDLLEEFEANLLQRLDHVTNYFNNELDSQAKEFVREQAKLASLNVKVHSITDRLEAILQRAASRLTAQEANAASRVEELESTVDRLTHTLTSVCDFMGLEFNPPALLKPQPLTGQVPAGRIHWLGASSSSQQVKVQQANVEFATESLDEAATPILSVDRQPWYGTPVDLDTYLESQAARKQQAPVNTEVAIQFSSAPPPTLPPRPSACINAAPLVTSPLSTLAIEGAAASSTTTTTGDEVPANALLTVPEPTPASVDLAPLATAPLLLGEEVLPAREMPSSLIPPSAVQGTTVPQPPTYPKIQRVPATPQNSQDTQATHVTLRGSSQTDMSDASTTHPAGVPTAAHWNEAGTTAMPGPALQQTLAVPGRPRTRSQSRSASEDNGEKDSVKRKRLNDDEGAPKVRRQKK